jgi:hypothetical protein
LTNQITVKPWSCEISWHKSHKSTLIQKGENGEPMNVALLDKKKAEKQIDIFGYNIIASDMIPLDRQIKDFRSNE